MQLSLPDRSALRSVEVAAAGWRRQIAPRGQRAGRAGVRACLHSPYGDGYGMAMVTVHRSPVINIMRHWAWGRNDETYGECPMLSGAFARAFVTGLQGEDPRYVAATAGCKHFVVCVGGCDNHLGPSFSCTSSALFYSTGSNECVVCSFPLR